MSATPNPTPPTQPPQASATTCIVGCKLPHGLHMQLRDPRTKTVVEAHVAKGNNAARIVGGYGLTEAIPTEFMSKWLKQNENHPAVVNGSIFVSDTGRNAEARAREGRELKTGIEALDPIAHAKKFKLEPDAEAVKAYNLQKLQNPVRDRQQVD